MSERVNKRKLVHALVFTCFAFFAAMRNLNPVFEPTLFAEDGTWLAKGLTDGWLEALRSARPDYPVVLQVMLLALASFASATITGNALLLAPYFIAAFSWAVFAILAFATFKWIRQEHSFWPSFFAGSSVVLIPVGSSANEIFGRVLQLGFLAPIFLFFILEFLYSEHKKSPAKVFFSEVILCLLIVTNPLCILFLAIVVVFKALFKRQKRHPNLALGFALSSGFFIAGTLGASSGLPGPFDPSGLVAALSRSIVFPIAPWLYFQSSDTATILILLALLAVCVLAYAQVGIKALRDVSLLAVLVISSIAVSLTLRPSLTHYAKDYESSFPDRYYLTTNLLLILLILKLLFVVFRARGGNHVGGPIVGLLVCTAVLIQFGLAIEIKPRMVISTRGQSVEAMICNSPTIENGMVRLKIEPESWVIEVPTSIIDICK